MTDSSFDVGAKTCQLHQNGSKKKAQLYISYALIIISIDVMQQREREREITHYIILLQSVCIQAIKPVCNLGISFAFNTAYTYYAEAHDCFRLQLIISIMMPRCTYS